jgi:hypothetical protein
MTAGMTRRVDANKRQFAQEHGILHAAEFFKCIPNRFWTGFLMSLFNTENDSFLTESAFYNETSGVRRFQ